MQLTQEQVKKNFMQLTQEQVEQYQEQGYLLLPEYFSQQETSVMCAQIPAAMANDAVKKDWEPDGKTFRSLLGIIEHKFFYDLARHPRLLNLAQQLLDSEVYIFRSRINSKPAFTGGMWPWHQDYSFSHHLDGVPSPRMTKAIIFFDEVNEFNGPLYVIPGSHKEGIVDVETHPEVNTATGDKTNGTMTTSAYLPYTTPRETVAKLVDKQGIVATKGSAGTVLLINLSVVHGSVSNISPFQRRILNITYNSVENLPIIQRTEARPGNVHYSPLQSLDTEEADRLFSDKVLSS
ncbi:MAG TPA: phytanoyl-CoA dioxygenase family protein [Coleofasciculaceae cyanobacterium]|jgi:ectoine hydroxylase